VLLFAVIALFVVLLSSSCSRSSASQIPKAAIGHILNYCHLAPILTTNSPNVSFIFFTATSMKMTAFWDIALCCLVEVYRHFRGSYCFHCQAPDDDGSKHVWNVGQLQRDNTAQNCWRLSSLNSPRIFINVTLPSHFLNCHLTKFLIANSFMYFFPSWSKTRAFTVLTVLDYLALSRTPNSTFPILFQLCIMPWFAFPITVTLSQIIYSVDKCIIGAINIK
jgi:hypothetical protein